MMNQTDEIQNLFAKELQGNESIRKLQNKILKKTASYKDAEKYAELVGDAYAAAFREVVGSAEVIGGKLYFEIAKEVFPPGLHSIYSSTSDFVGQVIQLQNEAAEIGLKPLIPDYGEVQSDYLRKLAATKTEAAMDHVIASESKFYAQRVADRTIQKNAEAHANAGLEVRVTRIYDGIGVHNRKDRCTWCLERCGNNMTLSEAKTKDSFNRHPGCGCIIIYTSAKGKTTMQIGSGGWTGAEEYARIKTRKEYGPEDSHKSGFLPSDKYEMPVPKIKDFLLKPGAKHANEFFDVGYTPNDVNRLNRDIYIQYDEIKAYDKRTYQDGSERFSIDMMLGITKRKPFQIIWQRDTPESKPRFITAYRKDDDRVF